MNYLEEKKEKVGNSSGKKINIFKDDLAFSEEASEESFWQDVYKKAFPDMVDNIQCKGKSQGQKLGIDRLIYLGSGKALRIDEKKRRKVWNDFAIEYEHLYHDGKKRPGWIEKDLLIDYWAYAFMPIKKCYLFPWHLLRLAWIRYGYNWKNLANDDDNDKFSIIEAENEGYTTYSVGVPIDTLRYAVGQVSIIQL